MLFLSRSSKIGGMSEDWFIPSSKSSDKPPSSPKKALIFPNLFSTSWSRISLGVSLPIHNINSCPLNLKSIIITPRKKSKQLYHIHAVMCTENKKEGRMPSFLFV